LKKCIAHLIKRKEKRKNVICLSVILDSFSLAHMESSKSKFGSLITQLHNKTNEAKEAFDHALVELERQKAENEKQYKEQLEQLKEERRKWDEEKVIIEKLAASASPIVNLNVGGEKMSTSRATLTIAEGSLLATMFSGKWEDKLMKDTNGCIFLDYDPVVSKT
jgi:septum formation inhibitor MinC